MLIVSAVGLYCWLTGFSVRWRRTLRWGGLDQVARSSYALSLVTCHQRLDAASPPFLFNRATGWPVGLSNLHYRR